MVDENELEPTLLNKRQRSKIETRQKVLDAGRALFMQGGYDKATIRGIAKAAHMSTGAVFANFDSKSDLLLVIAEEEMKMHAEHLNHDAEGGTLLDRIVRACTADFIFFSERLHLLEALAILETDAANKKNRKARTLTGSRRERLWRIIEATIRESRYGTMPNSEAIGECIMSIHFDRCRHQAILNCKAEPYQYALKELLAPFLQTELKAA